MEEKNVNYSLKTKNNKIAFKEGLHDGIPIGLGYFAVSFSLGIAARNVGLSPFQSFLVSLLCNASAGEYAGFTLIGAGGTYVEIAIITLIANARYLLMSCALSQKMKPKTSIFHRMLVAFDVTDEIFAISIARDGYLNPNYTYGSIVIAAPCWALGTALGCIVGNLMPMRLVSAFSVALFGMFLAVIIPPAKKDKVIGILIVICFLLSYITTYLPGFASISSGTRTIILTVVISAIAAILFPKKNDNQEEQ